MKKLLLVSGIILVFCIPLFSQTNLIGPPLGLEYGMSYSETKTTLKGKDIELEKLKYEKQYKLPKGFKVAKVGKYKVLERKTDTNLACFNGSGELCAFQIAFRWFDTNLIDAKNGAISFYNQELKKAIAGKYSGEGYKEHKDPDQDGNIPDIAFRDEVGNEVGVYFQTRKVLLGHEYWILVFYNNEEILRAIRKQQKATDKL